MKKDKYNKPYMPGQAALEKQEQKKRKQKALEKKAKKLGVSNVETVGFVGADFGVPKDSTVVLVNQGPQRGKVFIGVDEARTALGEFQSLRFEEKKEQRIRFIDPIGYRIPLNYRVQGNFDYKATELDLLAALFGIKRNEPTFEDLEKEFEGLMENHERIMSHFK